MVDLLIIGVFVLAFFMIKHAVENSPPEETDTVDVNDTESDTAPGSDSDTADTERGTESEAETETDKETESVEVTDSETGDVVSEPTLADLIVGTWAIEGDGEFEVSVRTYGSDGTYRDRVWSYSDPKISKSPGEHYFYGANWNEEVTEGIVGTWRVEGGKLVTEGIDGDDGEFRRVEKADVKDGVLTSSVESLTYGDYEVWVPGTENKYYGVAPGKYVTAYARLGDLAVTTYDIRADGTFYCDTRLWMDPENNPGKGYTDWTLLDLDFIGRTGRYKVDADGITFNADADAENGLAALTVKTSAAKFFVSYRRIKGDVVSSAELTELKETLKRVES